MTVRERIGKAQPFRTESGRAANNIPHVRHHAKFERGYNCALPNEVRAAVGF